MRLDQLMLNILSISWRGMETMNILVGRVLELKTVLDVIFYLRLLGFVFIILKS